jgi:predicted acetyltransferase
MEFNYRPYDPEKDLDAYSRSIAEAFAADEKKVIEWIKLCKVENIRIVEVDGSLAGTTVMAPMGQYFGGNSVPMIGIAGVSIRPEFRGKGVAKRMLTATVQEMAADGIALSTLYPSTMPLYQYAGYEMAGVNHEFVFEFEHLPDARLNRLADLDLEVVPGSLDDEEQIRALYHQVACTQDGMLDRKEYIWERVLKPRDKAGRIYLIRRISDQQLRAYLVLSQENTAELDGWHQVDLHCVQALDANAWHAVFALLRSYQSMARKLVASVDTRHPLYQMLPEQRDPLKLKESWMTRILNLKEALEARGYAAGLQAELKLEIADELVPSNQGLWQLKIADGRAHAERIGDLDPSAQADAAPSDGTLRTSIRHLAPLYSGYVSAELLAQTGRIQASTSCQRQASALFSGSPPWMPDFF